MFSIVGYTVTAIVLLWGGWMDYKSRTVSNVVWISVAAAGLLIDLSLMDRTISLLVMIGICLFMSKVMKHKSGGADIKLYMALSFNCGLLLCAGTLLIAAVLAVIVQLLTSKKEGKIPAYSYIAVSYLLLFIILKTL